MIPIILIVSFFLFVKIIRGIQQQVKFEGMLNPQPDGKPAYVVFDLETTGLAPKRIPESAKDLEHEDYPYIVSIAWLVVSEDYQLIRSEHHLIRPPVEIPIEATRIHGITNEKAQAEGKELKPILERLASDFASAGKCAAHYLVFDQTVLSAERIRCGLPDPFKGIVGLDTMVLGAEWMNRRSFKLQEGVATVVPSIIQNKLTAHDALSDATAAAYLLIYSLQRRQKNGHKAFMPNPERPQLTVSNPGDGWSHVDEGDPVKLWISADQTRANFYTYGSIAGDGKVGELPSQALAWVIEQRSLGSDLAFTVAKKGWSSCVLDIHITTAAEIEAAKEAAFQKTLADLQKPYRPKKPQVFTLRVEASEAFEWELGLRLVVLLPHPDSFHPSRESEPIRFECNGTAICSIHDHPAALRLTRAVFSGYTLEAEVTEVKRKDKHGGREVVVSVDFVKP